MACLPDASDLLLAKLGAGRGQSAGGVRTVKMIFKTILLAGLVVAMVGLVGLVAVGTHSILPRLNGGLGKAKNRRPGRPARQEPAVLPVT